MVAASWLFSLIGLLCPTGSVQAATGAEKAHGPPLTCDIPPNPKALTDHAVLRDCVDTPELVAIPGGDFQMGDLLGNGYEYERPVHKVHINAFLMGRYEVTVAEWQACVRAGVCASDAGTGDAEPTHPVSSVSWDEAEQMVTWLSRKTGRAYRLPSEAEWEYAARAGSSDQYTWGNTENSICLHANIFDVSGHKANPEWTWAVGCDDGYAKAAPVGSYPPNEWGLYDMIGNVWEWVADCWHSDYAGAPDTAAPWLGDECSKRVNRGGGWGNHARTTRVSTRDADIRTARSDGLGFRVARSIIYGGARTSGTAESGVPSAPANPSVTDPHTP